MRIKKHRNRNEYLLAGSIWVRNFAKENVPSIDINNLSSPQDNKIFLENECENRKSKLMQVDGEKFYFPKIAIVSDGYLFDKEHEILASLPKDVCIIAVNGALKNWKLVGNLHPQGLKRTINFYVANNPYKECMWFAPKNHKYFPRCICSTRVNYNFLNEYRGDRYFYRPCPDQNFSLGKPDADYLVDDYRNPICAAIGLSYRFGVEKLLLFCCQECYEEQRPGMEKLDSSTWVYPQEKVANNIIDANLYWLSQKNVKIGTYPSELNYNNATYINKNNILEFFEKDEK